MIIFKCDICGTPFEYNSMNINYISFINKKSDDSSIYLRPRDTKLPVSPHSSYCKYHICPKCFDGIRSFINEQHKSSQK